MDYIHFLLADILSMNVNIQVHSVPQNIEDFQCHSVKSKTDKSRCPHSSKPNSMFCGIHTKSKNVILFHPNSAIIDTIPTIQINSIETVPVINPIAVNDFMQTKPDSIIHDEPIQILQHNDVENHMNSIQSKKSSKKKIIYRNRFMEYLPQILTIQKWVRKCWSKRIIKCVNNADFISFENLTDIPYPFVYFYEINRNIVQGYDIRSLFLYIHEQLKENPTKEIKNPYTSNTFSSRDIENIQNRFAVLRLNDKNTKQVVEPIDPEIQFRQHVLSIFQKMDLLDNYTNFEWFTDLDMTQLKRLYYEIFDIWAYRAQLTEQVKKNIVKNGIAFPYNYKLVDAFPNNPKNKRRLQNIILDEFNRFITEGNTRDDRKLGCMLMLTGLVEVSIPASNAMPQYVQSAGIY
jgi:hypothetical protein